MLIFIIWWEHQEIFNKDEIEDTHGYDYIRFAPSLSQKTFIAISFKCYN